MSDLISRAAAIKALGDEPEVWNDDDDYRLGLLNQWQEDVDAIRGLPSAERRGRWINRRYVYPQKSLDMFVCSECGYEFSYDAETGIRDANYCPNCGARMEE